MKQTFVRLRPTVAWRVQPYASALIGLLGGGWLLLLIAFGSGEVVWWAAHSAWKILEIVAIATGLYLIPGLAVLRLLWHGVTLSWIARLALACAIGFALPPLLLELASLIRLPWNTAMTVSYIALALIVLVYPRRSIRELRAIRLTLRIFWHDWMLGGLLSLALVVRLYVVRGLPVGMWGDSYHHTMIAQLLVDNRGLFVSWEPYAPLTSFTYHFGFHANVAFFHWVSGIPITQSILAVGQLLSTATLLAAYLLTTWLSNNRYAGLWAVVFTGFVNTMPVYYVNWGRYTQLTGQVLLPAILICWMAAIEHERMHWRSMALPIVLTASLLLTHYIVAIFAAAFISSYLVVWIILHRAGWSVTRQSLLRAFVIGGCSIILALPWLLNILSGYLAQIAAALIDNGVNSTTVAAVSTLETSTPLYLKSSILLLAGCGLIIAGIKRQWRIALCALWTAILILLCVPQLIGLPGTGVVKSFAVYIALYLTIIPLAAYAVGVGQQRLATVRYRLSYIIATGVLVLISVWGVQWQQYLLNPLNQLVMPADMQAMSWIRTQTAPDARFLVNMFPAFDNSVVVGSDAGWWIPLLTGRRTTLPPITYTSERASEPEYLQRINSFAAELREKPLPSEEGLRLSRAAGIGYIYHGTQIGKDSAGQDVHMDIEAIRRHPAFQIVYDEAGVTIFALEPAP